MHRAPECRRCAMNYNEGMWPLTVKPFFQILIN